MNDQASNQTQSRLPVHQPLTPEQVSPEQRAAHRRALTTENPTVNPGDRVQSDQSLAQKAQQVAVNVADITGEQVVIPTYFVVDYPNGERKALHHVTDAEEISDVIRQARMDESGNRTWW